MQSHNAIKHQLQLNKNLWPPNLWWRLRKLPRLLNPRQAVRDPFGSRGSTVDHVKEKAKDWSAKKGESWQRREPKPNSLYVLVYMYFILSHGLLDVLLLFAMKVLLKELPEAVAKEHLGCVRRAHQ